MKAAAALTAAAYRVRDRRRSAECDCGRCVRGIVHTFPLPPGLDDATATYSLTSLGRRVALAESALETFVADLPPALGCLTLGTLVARVHVAWQSRGVIGGARLARWYAIEALRHACDAGRVISLWARGAGDYTFAAPGAGSHGEALMSPEGELGWWL